MKKYLLSTWLKISGIVAASGIGYENNQLMLVSDNGNALYHYFIGNDSLAKYSFDEQPIMNVMKKKEKYDFDTFTFVDITSYAYGSGAIIQRTTDFMFNIVSKYSSPFHSTNLYAVT